MALIDGRAMSELLSGNARFALSVLQELAAQNARYVQRIAVLAGQGAASRLAGVLCNLLREAREAGSVQPSLPLSATDLGEMAGCSRQTASSWLCRMEKAGVIARAGGNLRVIQPERLAPR